MLHPRGEPSYSTVIDILSWCVVAKQKNKIRKNRKFKLKIKVGGKE